MKHLKLIKRAFLEGFFKEAFKWKQPAIGAGLGALGGLGYEYFRPKEDYEESDYLTSGLIGAGVGAGVGGLSNFATSRQQPKKPASGKIIPKQAPGPAKVVPKQRPDLAKQLHPWTESFFSGDKNYLRDMPESVETGELRDYLSRTHHILQAIKEGGPKVQEHYKRLRAMPALSAKNYELLKAEYGGAKFKEPHFLRPGEYGKTPAYAFNVYNRIREALKNK